VTRKEVGEMFASESSEEKGRVDVASKNSSRWNAGVEVVVAPGIRRHWSVTNGMKLDVNTGTRRFFSEL
jgi:hypothetical protein